jgi:hypothetical protein
MKKTIVKETTQEQSTSANSTPEQNISGKSTLEESAMSKIAHWRKTPLNKVPGNK